MSHPIEMILPRGGRVLLGTAYNGDDLVEFPLLDEVVVSLDAQGDAHGAVRPVDLAYDLCLDLFGPLGKISQDHIAELQPLNLHLDRHQAIVPLSVAHALLGPYFRVGLRVER